MSFRKITGPGKCGFLFEPGNPQDLLKVLTATSMLNWGAESAKTLKQFIEELSFEAIAGKLVKVISSI
jgi:glycosyltransferase involved in cell wall biosynthesis